MAVNFGGPPFPMTPQMTGVPDIAKSLSAGQDVFMNTLKQRLAGIQNQAAQAQLPYAGPQAAANVNLAQQQGNLAGAQATEAPALNQLRYAEAQRALAQQYGELPALIQFMRNGGTLGGSTNLPGTGSNISGGNDNSGSNSSASLSSGNLGNTSSSNFGNNSGNNFGGLDMNQPGMQAVAQKLYPGMYNVQQHQKLTDVNTYNAAQDQATDASNNAVMMGYNLSNLKNAYAKLAPLQQGFLGRFSPDYNSAAQLATQASAGINASLLKSLQTGHITDKDFAFSKGLGLDRTLNPDAFNTASNFLTQLQKRIQEQPEFLNAAKNARIDPHEAKILWTRYINERPVYDYDSNQPLTQNLNTWPSYLSKEARSDVSKGQPFDPVLHANPQAPNNSSNASNFNNQINNSTSTQTASPQQGNDKVISFHDSKKVPFIDEDGKQWMLPQGAISIANARKTAALARRNGGGNG